jgi:nucleoside 2-deoxyribosyltransferase
MSVPRFCFVIMPFDVRLHYFYLYLKQHVERAHYMECERGDAQVLTVGILDKIVKSIVKADVIIADFSFRNPNVFYELGMAHALGQKVILITQDDSDPPTDIRHLEFIRYDMGKHVEFFERLDNAIRNVFIDRYEALYENATTAFKRFREATSAQVKIASKEVFVQRISVAEQNRELPLESDERELTEFILPKIIADSSDISTMRKIQSWLDDRFPEQSPGL